MKSNNKSDKKYSYKEVRDQQIFVHSMLIGLMNSIATITLKQPKVKTIVTESFIPIKSLEFTKEDVVEFDDVIERCVEERKLYDIEHGVTSINAHRRKKMNRLTMSIDLLLDLLELNGMKYTSIKSIGKNGALVIDYVQSIHWKNISYNLDQIMEKGKLIHELLDEKVKNGKYSVIFNKNDYEIQKILDL